MRENLPNVLRKVYIEDKARFEQESLDECDLLKVFEMRKADSHYFKMIEKKKKKI